ncbi:MAG: hypothetical protein FWG82_03490 [Oscillospiraceae bacterium]|nr:hypothetical protein [Oscillospiraceae bacterium]
MRLKILCIILVCVSVALALAACTENPVTPDDPILTTDKYNNQKITEFIDKLKTLEVFTEEEVHKLVGEPDDYSGSGLVREVYRMGDGIAIYLLYWSNSIDVDVRYEEDLALIDTITLRKDAPAD